MTEKKISKGNDILVRLQTNPDVAEGRLNPALRIIAERCLTVMDIDRVNIWKMSPQEDIMQSIDSFDQGLKIHSSGEIISVHHYPAFLASLQADRFISAKDVLTDHRTAELIEDIWKPLNIVSALIVPIRIRGQLEGMIRFEQSRVKHAWTTDEETFACQVAEIISGVFLVSENREKEKQLHAHENTIAEMTRLSNYHTMLTEALHRAIDLTGARSALLFKNNPERREIQCMVSVNAPISFTGFVLKYGEGAAGSVAEVGRSLRIQDYQVWSGRAHQLEEQHPFTSVLAVPIRYQGRVIGVVEVAHHDVTAHFTEDQRRILEIYSHHIAAILEQSQLTEEIGNLTVHNNTLQQLISTASHATRLDGFLESTLNIVLKRLGLNRGVIRVEQTSVVRDFGEDEESEIHDRLAVDSSGFNSDIIVSDWREYSGAFSSLASLLGTMNVKACMIVPIHADYEYKGYVAIYSASPRVWRDDEIALMQVTARQVGLTTDKIKGTYDRDMVSKMMVRLNAITSDMNRLFTFDDAIARVGQGAVDLMNADHAAIFLKNPDGSLSVPWHFAITDSQIQHIIPAENKELARLLLSGNKPIFFNNHRSTILPPLFKKYMTNSAIETVICLPLVYSNQTVGTVITFHSQGRNLTKMECDILEAFTNQAAVTLQNAWMYGQLDKGYTEIALSLARAMDARDSSVSDLSQRVAKWAEETGRKLGLNDQEIKDLHWAALLHDIGKTSVPNDVLVKPGPLNKEEWKILQQHPVIGADLIQPLSRFQTVSSIIRNYRERFDGSGYPNRLKGEDIPLASRVLAVADAYGSIINDRSYHKARGETEAIAEIEKESGKQFDPIVVKSFIEIVQQKKANLPAGQNVTPVAAHKGGQKE